MIEKINTSQELSDWFWKKFDEQMNFGDYLRNVYSKKDNRKKKIKRLLK